MRHSCTYVPIRQQGRCGGSSELRTQCHCCRVFLSRFASEAAVGSQQVQYQRLVLGLNHRRQQGDPLQPRGP